MFKVLVNFCRDIQSKVGWFSGASIESRTYQLGMCGISMGAFLVLFSVCVYIYVSMNIFFFLFLLYISLKGCSFNMSIGNQRKERDIDNGTSWRHGNEWGTWELTAVSLLPQNLEFPQLVLSTSKCCTDFQNRSEGFFVLFYCYWRHHDHDSLYKENHLDELS